jgi:SAM-dependent methyltransferase
MSDEVRSNSSPAPPEAGGLPIDPVVGSDSLDIEFPTPDIEIADSESADPDSAESGPVNRPLIVESEPAAEGVTVLPNKDISSLRPQLATELTPPRPTERPPPPSQRVASPHRLEATLASNAVTPVPPPPSGARTLPAPSGNTLPAPAPMLEADALPLPAPTPDAAAIAEWPDSTGGVPLDSSQREANPFEPSAREPEKVPRLEPPRLEPPRPEPPRPEPHAKESYVKEPLTEAAPTPRMLSEPVPLMKPSGAPGSKATLRPGLVEPKRIIEVLGSNIPVLDSALEEEAIEDLDESEAHEVSETPLPDDPPLSIETELEVNVVVEDDSASLAPALDRSSAKAEGDDDVLAAAASATSADGPEPGVSPDSSLEGPESPGRRVKPPPPNKRRRPPPPSSRSAEMRRVEPPSPGARKWWEEMFSEEFLRAIPILSPKQLEREVKFIDEALAVARGGRILDLACGAGQHAVELAARGYDLVGFDLSQSQLDWAGGLAQERNQRLQFTYGDMRELAYNEAFDAVYSWNTSFGFFEEEKNVDVAQRVFRALRPGGRFLLDVINRDFVVAQQPGQTWFEGDGCVCIDDVAIDFITSRMKVKRTLMLTNGKNRECNYSLRIYGLHELGKILHDVGFKVLNVSGRPEMPGVFFGASSPRVIILAVKP